MNLARVCSFVHLYIHKYLEIHTLLFSETLKLVRTQKGGKKFFLKNSVLPILCQNCPKFAFWPKMPKNWGICIFVEISSLQFAIFYLSLVSWVEKLTSFLFWEIWKWPFVAKIAPNWAIWPKNGILLYFYRNPKIRILVSRPSFETLRLYVRSSVCDAFLRNRSSDFSEVLYEVRF